MLFLPHLSSLTVKFLLCKLCPLFRLYHLLVILRKRLQLTDVLLDVLLLSCHSVHLLVVLLHALFDLQALLEHLGLPVDEHLFLLSDLPFSLADLLDCLQLDFA